MSSRSTLVVVTRGRVDDCRVLLSLLSEIPDLPARVLLVDASDDSDTRALCEPSRVEEPLRSRLEWIRAEAPGIASQRNQALRSVESDIVHFLDDDSRPTPGYFRHIEDFFNRDVEGRIVGVTGRVGNPGRARRVSWLHRLFLLAPGEGGLNRAGRHAVVRRASAEPFRVQWLSGCTMSFRTQVLRRYGFDPRLQLGVTGGYALGEDLDASLRVSAWGELWCVPTAELHHELSAGNRADRIRYEHASSAFRRRLAADPDAPVGALSFWWSTFGDTLIAALNRALGRDPDGARVAKAIWTGALDRRIGRSIDVPREPTAWVRRG